VGSTLDQDRAAALSDTLTCMSMADDTREQLQRRAEGQRKSAAQHGERASRALTHRNATLVMINKLAPEAAQLARQLQIKPDVSGWKKGWFFVLPYEQERTVINIECFEQGFIGTVGIVVWKNGKWDFCKKQSGPKRGTDIYVVTQQPWLRTHGGFIQEWPDDALVVNIEDMRRSFVSSLVGRA